MKKMVSPPQKEKKIVFSSRAFSFFDLNFSRVIFEVALYRLEISILNLAFLSALYLEIVIQPYI